MIVTLYKRNTNNQKIQQWSIELHEDGKHRTLEGYYQGKISTNDWTQCVPKNIGKKSETTSYQQALKEYNAKIKKKKEKAYTEDFDEIDNVSISFEPMLANKYTKFMGVCFSQPKLDGIRCITKKDSIKTRTGKDHLAIPHIVELTKMIHDEFPNIVLDGELYNHDYKSNFNKITSIVRKAKPTQTDLEESKKIIQYHIYDCYFTDRPQLSFKLRNELLYDFIKKTTLLTSESILFVDTVEVENKNDLDSVYGIYLQKGYEGQMVRSNEPYEQKRSKALLKRKEFIDEEFEVVDIEEGVGNWAGKAKKIYLKKKDGTIFKGGIKGNFDYCKDFLENKEENIGKMANIRFQEYTPDGIPRFAVLYSIRDYE